MSMLSLSHVLHVDLLLRVDIRTSHTCLLICVVRSVHVAFVDDTNVKWGGVTGSWSRMSLAAPVNPWPE